MRWFLVVALGVGVLGSGCEFFGVEEGLPSRVPAAGAIPGPNDLCEEAFVTLTTADEADALCRDRAVLDLPCGLVLRGSFASLEGLECLHSVEGAMIVDFAEAAPTFAGLENLGRVGGEFVLDGLDPDTELTAFASLIEVGRSLTVHDGPDRIELPALRTVGDALMLPPSASWIELRALTSVGRLVVPAFEAPTMLDLSALAEAGRELEFVDVGELAWIELSGLQSASSVIVRGAPGLISLDVGDSLFLSALEIHDAPQLDQFFVGSSVRLRSLHLSELPVLAYTPPIHLHSGANSLVLENFGGDPSALQGVDLIADVVVRRNPGLHDLSFLEGLQAAHSIVVEDNPDLVAVAGFGGVQSLRTLIIRDNPALVSVDGFDAVATFADEVTIVGNDALESVAGFGALQSAWGLSLGGAALLENSAFGGLTFVRDLTLVGGNVPMPDLGFPSLVIVDDLLSLVGFDSFEFTLGGDGFGFGGVSIRGGSATSLGSLPIPPVLGVGLEITDTLQLEDISALASLEEVLTSVLIENNARLQDVTPLHGLGRVSDELRVRFNPLLSAAAVDDLVQAVGTVGTVTTEGNGTGL